MKNLFLFVGLVFFMGCATITYNLQPNGQKKEQKNYSKSKFGTTPWLENMETTYFKNGSISYKSKCLGSGLKILNRIVEIEKDWKEETGDK